MSQQEENIIQNDASAEIARLKAMVDGNEPSNTEEPKDLGTDEVNGDTSIENQKPKTDEKEVEQGDANTDETKSDVVNTEEKKTEPSDEDILAYLKSKNIEVNSIDDLKAKISNKPGAEEDDADAETKVAVKKLEIKKWAIEKQKIDPRKLEQFEEDSKLSDIELAYRVYFNERKGEDNPSTDEPYTDEELREEFEAENYLGEDDDSPLKKRKLRNISLIAQTYKYDNYKELNDLEKSFDNEMISTSEVKILNETIATAKAKIIESGMSYTIKDDLGNDVVINIPITKKLIDEIELTRNEVEDISNTNDISSIIEERYFVKNKGKVLHEVATAYHSKKILDLKASSIGIENRKAQMQEAVPSEIDEKLKKLIEKHTTA